MSELRIHRTRGIEALQADSPVEAICEVEAAIGKVDNEFDLADCYYWLATAQYVSCPRYASRKDCVSSNQPNPISYAPTNLSRPPRLP